MSELKKHIYDEKNGLHYTLIGDYYMFQPYLIVMIWQCLTFPWIQI